MAKHTICDLSMRFQKAAERNENRQCPPGMNHWKDKLKHGFVEACRVRWTSKGYTAELHMLMTN
eukprot:1158365-Pelagomonas_calceolata.AAC.2